MDYEPRDPGSDWRVPADTDEISTARLHSCASSATSRPVVFDGTLSVSVAGRCASMGNHWTRGIGGRTPGTPAGRLLRDGAVARTAVPKLASAYVATLRRRAPWAEGQLFPKTP